MTQFNNAAYGLYNRWFAPPSIWDDYLLDDLKPENLYIGDKALIYVHPYGGPYNDDIFNNFWYVRKKHSLNVLISVSDLWTIIYIKADPGDLQSLQRYWLCIWQHWNYHQSLHWWFTIVNTYVDTTFNWWNHQLVYQWNKLWMELPTSWNEPFSVSKHSSK